MPELVHCVCYHWREHLLCQEFYPISVEVLEEMVWEVLHHSHCSPCLSFLAEDMINFFAYGFIKLVQQR